MNKRQSGTGAQEAMARLFRAYMAYCKVQSVDSLFFVLTCLHSLRDRMKGGGTDLLREPEFLALKCLRNYMHHQGELRDRMKVIHTDSLAVDTDLGMMCLIPADVVIQAIESVDVRHRQQACEACLKTFKCYGNVVNISPAVFNIVVKAALAVEQEAFDLSGCEEFRKLWTQIEMERERGFPHFVTGDIYTHAGSVDELLSRIMGE